MQFIHKKTGKRYWVISAEAKDSTNCRDGLPVVVYCRGDERDVPKNDWYVRDAKEFYEQFEPTPLAKQAIDAERERRRKVRQSAMEALCKPLPANVADAFNV